MSATGNGPAPQVVWTSPVNEAIGVGLTQSIRVQFDRFLLPASAIRQSICIQAGTVGASTATDQCLGGTLAPQYDPVDRVVIWKPQQPLPASTRLNVRLLAAQGAGDPNGIRAFDGVPLESEYRFAFTTGDNDTPTIPEPARDVDYCNVPPLDGCALPTDVCDHSVMPTSLQTSGPNAVLTSCAGFFACHMSAPPPMVNAAVGGALLLTDPNGGTPAAVDRLVKQFTLATETATGTNPTTPERTATTPFGQNMPYIDARNPGTSYLLYKALLAIPQRCPDHQPQEETARPNASACSNVGYAVGGFGADQYSCAELASLGYDGGVGCTGTAPLTGTPTKVASAGDLIPAPVEPWVPDADWHPPAPGEYNRLRTRIRGQSMSPGQGPNGSTLRQDALTLSAWIAAGAPTSASCP